MVLQKKSLSKMTDICKKIQDLNVSTSCSSTIPQLQQEFEGFDDYLTSLTTPVKTRPKRSFEWLYRAIGFEDEYTTSLMVRKAANTLKKLSNDIEKRNLDLNNNLNNLIHTVNSNENRINSEISKTILTNNFIQTELTILNNLRLLKNLKFKICIKNFSKKMKKRCASSVANLQRL
jgi:hypothetical protein